MSSVPQDTAERIWYLYQPIPKDMPRSRHQHIVAREGTLLKYKKLVSRSFLFKSLHGKVPDYLLPSKFIDGSIYAEIDHERERYMFLEPDDGEDHLNSYSVTDNRYFSDRNRFDGYLDADYGESNSFDGSPIDDANHPEFNSDYENELTLQNDNVNNRNDDEVVYEHCYDHYTKWEDSLGDDVYM